MSLGFDVEKEYLGEWEPLIYDKEKDVQVFLRIRPLTEEHIDKNQKKYGKLRMNKSQGVRQRQVPPENQKKYGRSNVLFMWTGIRNGYVYMANEATASFFGECLGKKFTVGDTILIPEDIWHEKTLDEKAPRPFDKLKTLMVNQDARISTKVAEVGLGTDDEAISEAKAEAAEEVEQEKELEKN